jgi:SAM-dependent methyltransferase
VVHALSTALFNRSISIPEFPSRPDIVGCGLTDWEGYAGLLDKKFSYTNTFYHTTPFLDIANVTTSDAESLDFLISSDVFEHVQPPVSRAFENSRRLLKPTGVFILTVPYGLQPETIEHFPNLHDFEVVGEGDDRQLLNVSAGGTAETFSDLVFHGGAGNTLEMRVFSKDNLVSHLREAGFSRVTICSDPCFEHGIFWWLPWSLPIIARP